MGGSAEIHVERRFVFEEISGKSEISSDVFFYVFCFMQEELFCLCIQGFLGSLCLQYYSCRSLTPVDV